MPGPLATLTVIELAGIGAGGEFFWLAVVISAPETHSPDTVGMLHAPDANRRAEH